MSGSKTSHRSSQPRRLVARGCLGLALAGGACGDGKSVPQAGSDNASPWASAPSSAAPRPGMVWIPRGTLLAGTPADRVPRVPDAELAHQPFDLDGFYIDLYPHPNEPGAIPTTNVDRHQAAALCDNEGKRLCSELELERACKGPDNLSYPYGDDYRPDVCGTGRKGEALAPSGFHALCVSGFGVADTHGTVWLWTSSDYGRGTEGLAVLKGGNSSHGELVGRCAHVRGDKPGLRAVNIGVRCCAGPVNPARVELAVSHDKTLSYRRGDAALGKRFEERIGTVAELAEGSVPAQGGAGGEGSKFHVERTWTWHPLGNEELLLAGGCAIAAGSKKCGVFAARDIAGQLQLLVFVSTEKWQPTVGEGAEGRLVHVMGGDDFGAFRKIVAWDWGRVAIYGKERKKGRKRWVHE